MPADIIFEGPDSSAALHAKAAAFDAAIDASADFLIEMPDMDAVKAWKPLGEHIEDVQAFEECVFSARSNGKKPGDFAWDNLIGTCREPERFADLSECERLGVNALGALREPLVALAEDTCTLGPVTASTEVHAVKVDDFEPDVRTFLAPAIAARTLVESIPAKVLADDFDEAMRRLELASQGSAAIGGLPWYLGHLGWCMSVNQVFSGCKCLLANAPRPLDWHVVRDRLDHMRPLPNLKRALLGERAFGIKMFRALHDGSFAGGKEIGAPNTSDLTFGMLDSFDFAFYLDHMAQEIDRVSMPLPLPDFPKEDWQVDMHKYPRWAPVTAFLMPKLEEGREKTIQLEANRLLALIAIEANVHGTEAAMHMASSIIDPFDGKPLRTRDQSGVFSVWSVGLDHEDEGGSSEPLPLTSPLRTQPADLVWKVRSN